MYSKPLLRGINKWCVSYFEDVAVADAEEGDARRRPEDSNLGPV